MILNGTSLTYIKALLVLNWQYCLSKRETETELSAVHHLKHILKSHSDEESTAELREMQYTITPEYNIADQGPIS